MNEILSAFHVSISDGGRPILTDMTFSIMEGEIMGLVPIDNQGFSEFLQLLRRSPRLDKGYLSFDGKEIASVMHGAASDSRVAFIGKEPGLIPSLSIEDNFFVLRRNSPYLVNKRRMHAAFSAICDEYGLDIDGASAAADISDKDRVRIEMIKAAELGYRLIVMIDISSFLGPKDSRDIQHLIEHIAAKGCSFIYISSHHEELLSFTDRIMLMKSGSMIFIGKPSEYDGKLIRAISGSYCLIPGKARDFPRPPIGSVEYGGISIPFSDGRCTVILDLDNHVPGYAYLSLCGKDSPVSILLHDDKLSLHDSRLSFIPADPRFLIFPEMDYIENMAIRASEKIPLFWERKKRFYMSIKEEYGLSDGIEGVDLYNLTEDDLYDLVYSRVELESPDAVAIIEPFMSLDLEGRMNVKRHLERLCGKGIAVIVFAISLSDTLQIADSLTVLQNGSILISALPEDFPSLQERMPMLR